MKKYTFALLLLLSTALLTNAQTITNYWIVFKDKKNNPYSLEKPESYLSQRSIARRERQHIPMNERDLPVNPSYVDALKAHGAVVKNKSRWYNGATVTLTDENKLNELSALPFVKSITKIIITPSAKSAEKFDSESMAVPQEEDDLSVKAPEMIYNYGASYNQVHMIDVDCMHGWGYTGEGMVIAQLDAGYYNVNVFPAFDSLLMNHQLLGCRDFVTGDTLVFEDYPHGMNVLSCMVGNLPGQLIGTAPKAKYWLLRTEDAGSESLQEEINWMVGAEFADSVGADIINSSLGYNTFDDASTNHTYADMDGNTTIVTKAADWAASVGMFVVSSAGNSGGPSWYKITAPADADSVLTVGAVDGSGVITNFSSRGPTYDGRIKPNTVAKGGAAVTASNSGGVTTNSGTSFSAPITSGAVACLWQAHPEKTNMELLQAIEQSSSQYNAPDTVKGYGIPDFCLANFILAGINEQQLSAETLNVYPNPFSTNFDISFYSLKKQNAVIELVDISGRRISAKEIVLEMNTDNRLVIPGSEALSKGIYILKIKTGEKLFTKKIVKE